MSHFSSSLRKTFLSGLLFWVPLIITVFIVRFVLQLVGHLFDLIPSGYLPETYIGIPIPGINILFILILILLSGWAVNLYIGKKVVAAWEKLLKKIPLIRSVYNASKQSMNALFSSEAKTFNEVVLVEYPRRDMWSVAFITNESTEDFGTSSFSDGKYISVYIPTTPNPTSGFIVIVPKKDIRPIDLSTEEAFKWVISLGIINPKDNNGE